MSELFLEAVVIALMLAINALFAAYEIALASVSRARLSALEKRRALGAGAALFMKEHMEGSLALVQLAITLAGAVAAATGGNGVGEYLVPWLESTLGLGNGAAEFLGITIFVLPFSVFSIIFSELVPKMFAIENNERITLALSPLMRALYTVFHSLIALFEKTVRLFTDLARRLLPGPAPQAGHDELEELLTALSAARSRKAFGLFEERLAGSALELSRRTVRSALVSAKDVSCIPVSATLSEALIRAHADMHTRFPVVEKDNELSTALGYLNFKDIVTVLRLNPSNPTVRGITRPLKTIAPELPLSKALQEMMSENVHMALVREGGSTLGIITLEDILETLVGQITDEYDRLPAQLHQTGGSLLAGGGAKLAAARQALGLSGGDDRTLSQWAHERLGRRPRGGDIIRAEGLELWVRKTRRGKLLEAVVLPDKTAP